MDSIHITNYEINTGFGLRLALVTDLHSMPYEDLLMLLQKERPDAILLAGDILERHEEGESEWNFVSMEQWQFLPEMQGLMVNLMRVLDRLVEHNGVEAEVDTEDFGLAFLHDISKLAPVFMSVGNHEWYFTAEDEKFFIDHNIMVLDNADVQITIKDKKLRIGGLSTRYDLEWLKEYSKKDGIKILLCHHPEHYRYKIKDKIDTFDLVLSGHYHGGQWRIGNVGVYVPRIGLMVPKVRGQFGKQIISAGVSNTTRFPRWGNPRELVMIRI